MSGAAKMGETFDAWQEPSTRGHVSKEDVIGEQYIISLPILDQLRHTTALAPMFSAAVNTTAINFTGSGIIAEPNPMASTSSSVSRKFSKDFGGNQPVPSSKVYRPIVTFGSRLDGCGSTREDHR